MNIVTLATKSLLNRRFTLSLTLLSIAISLMMLLGVERLQQQIKTSFTQTISDTDLIVGARTGQLNLLLYSVFGMGDPTNNISWQSYQQIAQLADVAWTVPISLGDSHQGYRVVGTEPSYFEHRRYANKTPLEFIAGHSFSNEHQLVLGADVAQKLGYQLGDELVLSHGVAKISFSHHQGHPFMVSGILQRTGTPIDQRLFVNLEAIDHMHDMASHHGDQEHQQHGGISAFYLGAKSKFTLLTLLRDINEFKPEPLLAILPQVALQQLWQLMSMVEKGLMLLAILVVVTGLIGMLTNILTNLTQRQREMAILRAIGAAPRHIFMLLMGETALLALLGCVFGVLLFFVAQWSLLPIIQQQLGMKLVITGLTLAEWKLLVLVFVASVVLGLVPAFRAYRMTLHDGMQVRS
ncbi:ABC transporter permease [Neptunicella sp.]|uniref:ABC transporter permease n=1 Tax=Neptunicella sp. TaxID=2125986 RepID=UPI003F68DC11